MHFCFIDSVDAHKNEEKTDEIIAAPKTRVSSISLNIPAAGLGTRPPSIISTSTLDEGGFNEPYPEIKARLKPHDEKPTNTCVLDESSSDKSSLQFERLHSSGSEDSSRSTLTSLPEIPKRLNEKEIEALYAVPHKPNSLVQQKSTTSTESDASQQKSTTSTDSEASQVTVVQNKSVDSDIMYNNPSGYITNSVLAQLESQESYEKVCQGFLQHERASESVLATDKCDRNIGDSNVIEVGNALSSPSAMVQEDNVVVNSLRDLTLEASILDLNDVEFADASDGENSIIDSRHMEDEADAMTLAEQEKLLSTRQVIILESE